MMESVGRVDALWRYPVKSMQGESLPRAAIDARGLEGELSAALGQPVTLAREAAISHFDAAPIHIVTQASLAWLAAQLPASIVDTRRFRPNLVVDGALAPLAEQGWIDRSLRIGSTTLRLVAPTERCVMVTMAQAELGADPGILRQLASTNEACFGVYAEVVDAGAVAVGDPAWLD